MAETDVIEKKKRAKRRIPGELFYTAEEYGALIGVSDKSVYRVANADPTFPAVWFGGTLRISKARGLEWLAQRPTVARAKQARAKQRKSASVGAARPAS